MLALVLASTKTHQIVALKSRSAHIQDLHDIPYYSELYEFSRNTVNWSRKYHRFVGEMKALYSTVVASTTDRSNLDASRASMVRKPGTVGFLDLPQEIRDLIYNILLNVQHNIRGQSGDHDQV